MMGNKRLALVVLGSLLAVPGARAVDLGVFGDVGYRGSTEKYTADSFVQGQFDLYAMQRIDPKTKAFFELVVEADEHNNYGVDLERMYISRDITDNFNISLGRFHTPIGYWNTAYHHGALIQDTVLRPTFLNFEDGQGAILPTHLIGAMGMGTFNSPIGAFSYGLMVGNSLSINTNGFRSAGYLGTSLDVPNVADLSDQKAFGGRVIWRPESMPLEIGTFVLHDPVVESGGAADAAVPQVGSELIAMTVYGGHFRYATPRFDVLGETYNFVNDDKLGHTGTHDAAAYFIQFGYRVTDAVKLIYRLEDVDFVTADPYFQYLATPEGSRHVVDLRYDIDDTNALKFEVAQFEPVHSGVKSYTFYALQWAFLMF